MSAINENQEGIPSAMGLDVPFRSIASETKFTDIEGIERELKGSRAVLHDQMVIVVAEINPGNRATNRATSTGLVGIKKITGK